MLIYFLHLVLVHVCQPVRPAPASLDLSENFSYFKCFFQTDVSENIFSKSNSYRDVNSKITIYKY